MFDMVRGREVYSLSCKEEGLREIIMVYMRWAANVYNGYSKIRCKAVSRANL